MAKENSRHAPGALLVCKALHAHDPATFASGAVNEDLNTSPATFCTCCLCEVCIEVLCALSNSYMCTSAGLCGDQCTSSRQGRSLQQLSGIAQCMVLHFITHFSTLAPPAGAEFHCESMMRSAVVLVLPVLFLEKHCTRSTKPLQNSYVAPYVAPQIHMSACHDRSGWSRPTSFSMLVCDGQEHAPHCR